MRASALPILSALLLLLSAACYPVVDDDGSTGDAGVLRDGGADGGGDRDGGAYDAGWADGGGSDAGPTDAGGDPCDGWPQTDYAWPGCGPAPLGVEFDGTELETAYMDNGCSFQGVTWLFGDDSSSTDMYPFHVFERAGDYYVRAEGDGVCCDAGSCYTLGLNLTDIPIRAY